MPVAALGLALGAAFLHALWNLLIARARDPEAATALAVVVGAVLFAPVAILTWRFEAAALPFALASAALELAYLVLLGAAYRRAELSLVYPIARGLAPVLVLAISVAVLAQGTSVAQAAGVALVGSGVLLVRGVSRERRAESPVRDVVLAASIAGCIAGYTLIDQQGLRHASPPAYLEAVLAPPGVVYLVGLMRLKGRASVLGELRVSTALAALAMFAAFALALTALSFAPAPAVSAVRESSVVIATILAALILREGVGRGRLAGSVLVVLGVACLAVG
jgi:drug/metabolite transporter (DMT)-like permease